MFEQAFKNIDEALRKEAGCSNELDYTEQTSWLLFLKYLDGLEQDHADEAALEANLVHLKKFWVVEGEDEGHCHRAQTVHVGPVHVLSLPLRPCVYICWLPLEGRQFLVAVALRFEELQLLVCEPGAAKCWVVWLNWLWGRMRSRRTHAEVIVTT